MALSTRRYVGLPPDGVGKKIASRYVLYLEYNNATGEFFDNDTVVGGTSAVAGTVLRVIPTNATTGQLVIDLDDASFNAVFTVGENLLVNSVVIATAANAGTEVFYNEVVLVGGNNPANRQFIDDRGAQYTTFAQGSPQLDAFGRLKVSSPTVIGTYEMFYSSSLNKFSQIIQGTGSVTYSPNESLTTLQVNTQSGSRVALVADEYHQYLPGIGLTILQTVVCGDTGKTNLIRRWGYFDDANGVFWEQSGSIINAVIRTSTSGTPIETRIPQSSWNVDRVDGSESPLYNVSKFDLDVTKNNIYFIDFQWLGAGRIRFGVVTPAGEIIASHRVLNANSLATTYMGKANLPLRYEILNANTTSGTSEFKVVCASVQADVENYHAMVPTINRAQMVPSRIVSSSTDFTHLFAARATQTVSGQDNRVNVSVQSFTGYTSAPMIVEMVRNADLTNPVWVANGSDAALEGDISATANVSGSVIYVSVETGKFDINFSNIFNNASHARTDLHRKADITASPDTYSVRAKLVSGSSAETIVLGGNWVEHR